MLDILDVAARDERDGLTAGDEALCASDSLWRAEKEGCIEGGSSKTNVVLNRRYQANEVLSKRTLVRETISRSSDTVDITKRGKRKNE